MRNRANLAVCAAFALVVGGVSVAVVHGAASGTSAESLRRLKAGNARFVADPAKAAVIDTSRRVASADAATPFAQVLTCSDARVPPEVVFQTGLADLHVVRAAGHVVDRSIVASLEWGAEQLHVPLLVVMGHQSCDTVRAAIEPGESSRGPNLDFLLKAIQPSVARAADAPDGERLRTVILQHVEESINEILRSSDLLRRRIASGAMAVVGAYYEQSSGRVLFSDVVDAPIHRPPTR